MAAPKIDPSALLIQFAQSLPITIKEVVLVRCCMAFDRVEVAGGQDYFATFRSILDVEDAKAIQRPYLCAALCGVMELALEHFDRDKELYEGLSAKHPEVELFAKSALQAPLKGRHWKSAREEFARLRAGPLSAKALHEWQSYLLATLPMPT